MSERQREENVTKVFRVSLGLNVSGEMEPIILLLSLLLSVSNGQQQQQTSNQQQLHPFQPPFPNQPLPVPGSQLQPGFSGFQPGSQRSEMLISFEQTPQIPGNPTAALASSQLMKLCSCTCQTMAPAVLPAPIPTSSPAPPPTTQPSEPPLTGPIETVTPETELPTSPLPPPTTTELPPPPTTTTEPPPPPTTITEAPTTTTTTTTTMPPPPPPTTTTPEPATEQTTPQPAPTSSPQPLPPVSACNSVEWVKPNMSVYSSSKVVWDVDRANQNYFLCNNLVDGELVPGKTHGFSCKVSSQGKALEVHNFNVLIKPESVNLAWVQKDSDSFGKTNLPVIGGYSKDNQEPYIISRCLVGDENNDVITLIGYVNNQGVGWFPFDDIQIECPQYDVLVCVNKF